MKGGRFWGNPKIERSMAEYLSPGVYVEEYDSSPRAIEGVGTSTAGFIGMTVKGPSVGAPSLVTSFADFQRQFGGYLSEYSHGEYRYLPASVEQFFANGGTQFFAAFGGTVAVFLDVVESFVTLKFHDGAS